MSISVLGEPFRITFIGKDGRTVGPHMVRPTATTLAKKRQRGGVCMVPSRSPARTLRRARLQPVGGVLGWKMTFSAIDEATPVLRTVADQLVELRQKLSL